MKKLYDCYLFWFIAIIISSSATTSAQHMRVVSDCSEDQILIFGKSDDLSTVLMWGDSIVETQGYNKNALKRFIIQFDSPPLAKVMAKRTDVSKEELQVAEMNIQDEHRRFISDLRSIEAAIRSDDDTIKMPVTSEILFEYHTVFNGMAVSTKRWLADSLRSMPYVRSIHFDKEIKALLDQSVPHIGADQIWDTYDVTGEGIVIGILDSGIDYMHPDLGGGIGPEYKVLGGYDFFNDNDDPMDDNGHGTHVAGITAANGQLLGVAPDASLMAYKVLGPSGKGRKANGIAAIEQAVNDGVHVLNASLGGSGHSNDPMAQAINNASLAGVVCVVAAGNAGPKYESILSPGLAQHAITVGATHSVYQIPFDYIAIFSSRGPVEGELYVKPDIVAPGVGINSTIINNGYASFNGTSMASPHIAGAVALFLEMKPDYTPYQIKSLFIQTADDLGYELWAQGGGMVNMQNIFDFPEVLADPALISFGEVYPETDYWSSISTITIHNTSNQFKNIEISSAGNFPEATSLSINPQVFSLSAGSSKEVIITIEADNELLPFPENENISFTDKLHIEFGNDEITVPMTFIRSRIIQFEMEETPFYMFMRGGPNNSYQTFISYPDTDLSLRVPEGDYDIFVQYQDKDFATMHENIEPDPYVLLEINKEQAINHIEHINYDINGNQVFPQYLLESFINQNRSSTLVSGCWEYPYTDRYFSNFNAFERLWYGMYYDENNNDAYLLSNVLFACEEDEVQTYEPSALKHVSFVYPYLEESQNVYPLTKFVYHPHYSSSGWIGDGFIDGADPLIEHPFIQKYYLSPYLLYENYKMSYTKWMLSYNGHDFQPQNDIALYKSPRFSIFEDDNLYMFRPYFDRTEQLAKKNKVLVNFEEVNIGLSPPSWNGFLHLGGNIMMIDNIDYLFLSQMMDLRHLEEIPFRLYKDEALINSGNILSDLDTYMRQYFYSNSAEVLLEPGNYLLEVELESFPVQQQTGQALVELNFNTSAYNTYLPKLLLLNVLADGHFVDHVCTSQDGIIQFAVKMDQSGSNDSSVTLEYSIDNEASWIILPLQNEDELYFADIPAFMPEGYISLRITAIDTNGYSMVYTIEPAFLRENTGNMPVVETADITDIDYTTAVSGGNVNFFDAEQVTARGIVWSKSPFPGLENNDGFTSDGAGTGDFISHLTGLTPGESYYVRAYATTSEGVSYGGQKIFETLDVFTITLTAEPINGGTVIGDGEYPEGETVEISAIANTGWEFTGWTGDIAHLDDPSSSNATVTMPDDDIIITANFIEDDTISPPDWLPVENLQYSMNIIGVLELSDGSISINQDDLIAGFVNDECRGVTSPLEDEDGLFFLTIGSNQMFGENITFKAYISDQGIIVDLDQEIIFENLLVVGSLAEPFVFTYEGIKDHIILKDITVEDGSSECFNAKKTITVAGDNSFFIVKSGGEAKLIAGESIVFLPGTLIKSGGYLHAYIDDVFCDDLRPINKMTEVIPKDDYVEKYELEDDQLFRVYPNPTDGYFTLELTSFEAEKPFRMEIFGLYGNMIKHQELNHQKQHKISLIDQKPGMYIVRVTVGDRIGIERLIKR